MLLKHVLLLFLTLPFKINGCAPKKQVIHNVFKDKCTEYINEIRRMKAIAGGRKSTSGEYPHMAALGYERKEEIQWNCGGSLISRKFILTAAHCLHHYVNGEVKYVLLGETIMNWPKLSKTAKIFRILNKFSHSEYNSPSSYHDIALLELEEKVKFTNYIKPACLCQEINIIGATVITATGWGQTEFAGKPSNNLQTVYLDIFTAEECKTIYKELKNFPQGYSNDKQICAGGKNRNADTCLGDSGGPLQLHGYLHQILGVTSGGKFCGMANVPSIYTRVSYYILWIEKIVWP